MFLLCFLDAYIYAYIYKYGLKFTKSSTGWIHSLTLPTSRCWKDLFKNIKDGIILGAFKSKHLQAYEKDCWRFSGHERIIREYCQNYLFDKRETSCNKPSTCKKRQENVCVKRLIANTGIPSSICKEAVCRVPQKAGLKWTNLKKKGIQPKMI